MNADLWEEEAAALETLIERLIEYLNACSDDKKEALFNQILTEYAEDVCARIDRRRTR